MSRVDLDAPEHALCSDALMRARELIEDRTASAIRYQKRAEKLQAELEATRRTAGYLARMVRAEAMGADAFVYAGEVLDTPEIAAALKAADGDSDSGGTR